MPACNRPGGYLGTVLIRKPNFFLPAKEGGPGWMSWNVEGDS